MYTGHGGYNFGRAFLGKNNQALLRAGAIKAIQGMGMYTGHGAYSVGNNLVSGTEESNSVPMFSGTGNETGDIVITHREYLTDIFGPTTSFNVQSYPINPGLDQTFPWLSQIACNYEEYEFSQLLFEYRSTTTDIGSTTNGQCGTVIMATNYNAASLPFSDKATMMEYAHAMSVKTTENMVHGVECDPNKLGGSFRKYVRTGPINYVPGGTLYQDLKTYDHSLFQYALANSPTGFQNQVIGELWVYYTVRLSKPRLFVTLGKEIDVDQYCTPSTVPLGATATGALMFPTTQVIYTGSGNSIGTVLSWDGARQNMFVTFPAAFTGAVEIRTLLKCITAPVGGAQPAMQPSINSGNIVDINDMYTANGNPINFYAGTNMTTSSEDSVFISHYYIRSATGGINNVIKIAGNGNLANTAQVQWYLTISRYNSLGITNSTALPGWLTAAGSLYPGNAI